MGLTLFFSDLQVLFSHLWEKEKEGEKKEKGRKEKGIEKEWKDEGRKQKDGKKDKEF